MNKDDFDNDYNFIVYLLFKWVEFAGKIEGIIRNIVNIFRK